MRRSEIIAACIILLSFAAGLYFYPQMPEKISSHWNAQGEVDGYMPKFWGLFLMPFISAFLLLLFILIPRIDPLKANIENFRRYYDGLVILMSLFMFYLYLLTILWNIGLEFSMPRLLSPAFGILFYYCGILTENAKRNWFVGIRTPWTMSSDRVWDRTHKIGGKMFKISGVIACIGVFLPDYALLFVIIPVVLVAVYTVIYSYLEFQKEIK